MKVEVWEVGDSVSGGEAWGADARAARDFGLPDHAASSAGRDCTCLSSPRRLH